MRPRLQARARLRLRRGARRHPLARPARTVDSLTAEWCSARSSHASSARLAMHFVGARLTHDADVSICVVGAIAAPKPADTDLSTATALVGTWSPAATVVTAATVATAATTDTAASTVIAATTATIAAAAAAVTVSTSRGALALALALAFALALCVALLLRLNALGEHFQQRGRVRAAHFPEQPLALLGFFLLFSLKLCLRLLEPFALGLQGRNPVLARAASRRERVLHGLKTCCRPADTSHRRSKETLCTASARLRNHLNAA